MENKFFNSWIPFRFEVPLLVLLTLFLGFSSGITFYTINYVISGIAAEPADGAFCAYAYFAGMVVGFSMSIRLTANIAAKYMLVYIILVQLLLNYVLTQTDSVPLLCILTFLMGILRIMGGVVMIQALTPLLMPFGQRHQVYAVYFPLILTVNPISGLAMTLMSDRFGWHFSFHFCNLLLFAALLITLVAVRYRRKNRVLAMWKYDWFSHVLMSVWMIAFLYVLAYGNVRDWFHSRDICTAAGLAISLMLLLLLRNALRKNPLLDFTVMKLRNVRIGLVLMFLLGAFFGVTYCLNTWMSLAFRNNQVENAWVNLVPIAGYLVGAVICYYYFRFYNGFKLLTVCVAVLYTFSFVLLYTMVDLQVTPSMLVLPMFIRGIAIVLSYVVVGLYITSEVDPKHLMMIPYFLIFFRTFLGPVFWGNIFSSWMYYRQIKLLDKMASWGNSDLTDALFSQRFGHTNGYGTSTAAYAVFHQQAVLGSVKELFGWLILAGCVLTVLLLLLPFHRRVDRKVLDWRRRSGQEEVASAVTV